MTMRNIVEPGRRIMTSLDGHGGDATEKQRINDRLFEIFLDYVGLGFVLSAIDILARDGSILHAGIFLAAGFATLSVGLNWSRLRTKFAALGLRPVQDAGVGTEINGGAIPTPNDPIPLRVVNPLRHGERAA